VILTQKMAVTLQPPPHSYRQMYVWYIYYKLFVIHHAFYFSSFQTVRVSYADGVVLEVPFTWPTR
jgi:hypothetical protein